MVKYTQLKNQTKILTHSELNNTFQKIKNESGKYLIKFKLCI